MRIVTRPDFDGIVCAVLLHRAETITEPVKWIEPGEIQRGAADLKAGDILANLPFDQRCSLWFDHHITNEPQQPFEGAFRVAPSAAVVIYDHYRRLFGEDYQELVAAANKIDSADLTMAEVLHPELDGFILISMTISGRDPADEAYWDRLVDLFRHHPLETVLADPEVKRRCSRVVEQNRSYRRALETHTRLEGQVSITDFRDLMPAPEGNRFLSYSLFPDSVVSVKIRHADESRERVLLSIGHSIFNRHCQVNVGRLLSRFGGGGHRGAGGCSLPAHRADDVLAEVVKILVRNHPDAETPSPK
jgi:oligoribonuclease NrnB/cAMP/cGMP phosphodiesterase (DHH superfamily)